MQKLTSQVSRIRNIGAFSHPLRGQKVRQCYSQLLGALAEKNGNYGQAPISPFSMKRVTLLFLCKVKKTIA